VLNQDYQPIEPYYKHNKNQFSQNLYTEELTEEQEL
jgi:hypothetical protein